MTLLTILSGLNSAVVWMASTRVHISNSSSPFTNTLVTVPSVPFAIGITVTFMFNSFFQFLARSTYLSFFSPSFNFTGTSKFTIRQVLVHFKNSPEYLTRGTARIFFPLMSFLLNSLVLSSFLVLLRYSFSIFFFLSSPFIWWCLLPIFPSICKFLFFGRSEFSLIW